jgi:hypothetical protein
MKNDGTKLQISFQENVVGNWKEKLCSALHKEHMEILPVFQGANISVHNS